MRWNKKQPPKENDIRIKTRFLLFPKCINNEGRWLEKTSWTQKLKGFYYDVFDELTGKFNQEYIKRWKDMEWINKEEQQ